METRHPIGESFGSEFLVICNRCVFKVSWSSRPWNFVSNFCIFFVKTTPYGKIFKILSQKFKRRRRSTLLHPNVVKFVRWEIGENVRYLPDKKISAASKTVATAGITPILCQSQPTTMCSQCSRFHPNRFTIGGVIAESVNVVCLPLRVFPLQALWACNKTTVLLLNYVIRFALPKHASNILLI